MSRNRSSGMGSFFEPKSVAVAGVSSDPGKLGSIIFANLRRSHDAGVLKAPVYPLNPAHSRIDGQICYPTIASLPEVPELLVVAVPASLAPGLAREAAEAGVKAAVMVTSGFAEAGRGHLEQELKSTAAKHGMRILGPNTIGILDTRSGVDTLFLRPTKSLPDGTEVVSLLKPLRGGVVVVTQSGHLGEIISEELAAAGVGIRALVGTGNQLDVSTEDIVDYFAQDQNAKVIVLYLEGVSDGRRFMAAASRAAKRKPVVAFKVGKTQVGARAALTHTASIVGDYGVYQAAFRRAGIVEARDIQDLVDLCVTFSTLPRHVGRRLVVVTNAGGVGVVAADEAARRGLDVSALSENEQKRILARFSGSGFVANASMANPIDLTASVSTDEFVKAAELVLGLPRFDVGVIIPTHQTPMMTYDTATKFSDAMKRLGKPTVMCVMGESELASDIRAEFARNGIPSFSTPERAVRAVGATVAYEQLRSGARAPETVQKADVVRSLRHAPGPLSQDAVNRLLRHYRVNQPDSETVKSLSGLRRARELGFPVACKLLSGGLIHKTEARGVVLNVRNLEGVRRAFIRFRRTALQRGVSFNGMLVQQMVKSGVEMILGCTKDPTFGPTLLFGAGGTQAELMRTQAVAIAPVTMKEAATLVEQSGLGKLLGGFRGGPALDVGILYETISRFSRIMVENPSIDQMEVNPLIANEDGMFAVDARAVASPT